jgi:hypothetical protein
MAPCVPPEQGLLPAGISVALAGGLRVLLVGSSGGFGMARTIQDWMHEGDELYDSTMRDCEDLESQIRELEQRLADKHNEVNRLAQILGKPLAHNGRRVTAQIVDDTVAQVTANSQVSIARALSGRALPR